MVARGRGGRAWCGAQKRENQAGRRGTSGEAAWPGGKDSPSHYLFTRLAFSLLPSHFPFCVNNSAPAVGAAAFSRRLLCAGHALCLPYLLILDGSSVVVSFSFAFFSAGMRALGVRSTAAPPGSRGCSGAELGSHAPWPRSLPGPRHACAALLLLEPLYTVSPGLRVTSPMSPSSSTCSGLGSEARPPWSLSRRPLHSDCPRRGVNPEPGGHGGRCRTVVSSGPRAHGPAFAQAWPTRRPSSWTLLAGPPCSGGPHVPTHPAGSTPLILGLGSEWRKGGDP